MSFEAFNLTAYAAEILDDRRILLAGYTSSLDFGLVRLTADGLIDNQFGTNGRSTTSFGSGQDIGRSLAVQPDGKILVAGYTDKGNGNYDFAVARYNPSGSLDTTFGSAGKVTTPIGDPTLAGDYAYKIGLQADGKIVVSGSSHLSVSPDSYYDFAVVRYLQNGSVDTTFGTNGTATVAVGTAGDFGVCQFVQPDDKILIGGWSESFIGGRSVIGFSLARFLPNGVLDNSFGNSGKVFTEGVGGARDLLMQPDGKLLMAGSTNSTNISVVRYNQDGSLDASFGANGIASIPISGSDAAGSYEAMALQPDGKILVGGWGGYVATSSADADIDFKLMRFNSNGTLDTSFGSNGLLALDFAGQRDYLFDMKLRDDGVIVAAGFTEAGSQTGLAVALLGTATEDLLVGSKQVDIVFGFDGDDHIDGGLGADDLYGGTGDDVYAIDSAEDEIFELPDEGVDTVLVDFSFELPDNLENVTLQGAMALNATGNAEANILTGNAAANTLDGAGGADSLNGGAGNDTYIVYGHGETIEDTAGTDLVKSYVTWTLAADLENLLLLGSDAINGTGNASANSLNGNAADNVLSGGDGVDTLVGGAGNDTLDGGAGSDRLSGGLGDDTYLVDDLRDTVFERPGQGIDTIQTTLASLSLSRLTAIEHLTFTGTGNAVLIGNALSNIIRGSTGNDFLNGSSGADVLVGAVGDDVYVVENTNDIVTEAASEGTDTVQSSVSVLLANHVENLTLTGRSAINGTGNDDGNRILGNTAKNTLDGGLGDDTLDGGAGNDVLLGGDGDDQLIGGNGIDILTGGDGADRFLFDKLLGRTNNDTITDFESGIDKILLDDAVFKKLIGDTDFSDNFFVRTIVGPASAQDQNDFIVFDLESSRLYYDADGSGQRAPPVWFATLTGVSDLSHDDFWIV
ncbi:Delta-60 repeat [Oxalobacteraceae bacterium]